MIKKHKFVLILFIIFLFSLSLFIFLNKGSFDFNKYNIQTKNEAYSGFSEITNETLEKLHAQTESLSKEEKEAFLVWIDEKFYMNINMYLRDVVFIKSTKLKKTIGYMESALKKSSLPQDIILYRIVRSDFIETSFSNREISRLMMDYPKKNKRNLEKVRKALINKTFVEKGFMATSYDKNKLYKSPIILKVNAKKGIRALAIDNISSEDEAEILIDKGYKWVISDVNYDKDKWGKTIWLITVNMF